MQAHKNHWQSMAERVEAHIKAHATTVRALDWHLLALARHELREYGLARDAHEHALSFMDASPIYHVCYAFTLKALGRLREAHEQMTRAIKAAEFVSDKQSWLIQRDRLERQMKGARAA